MDSTYRVLVPVAFWLGIVAFAVSVVMKVIGVSPLHTAPRGLLDGAQTLLLVALAAYCAHRAGQRSSRGGDHGSGAAFQPGGP